MKIYIVYINARPDYYNECFEVAYFSTIELANEYIAKVKVAIDDDKDVIHPFHYLKDRQYASIDIFETELDKDVQFLYQKPNT